MISPSKESNRWSEELVDVVEAQHIEGTRVQVTFEDGVTGVVDLASILSYRGIFAPLRDQAKLRELRVDPEAGTIVWPNGADIAPETLRRAVLEAASRSA